MGKKKVLFLFFPTVLCHLKKTCPLETNTLPFLLPLFCHHLLKKENLKTLKEMKTLNTMEVALYYTCILVRLFELSHPLKCIAVVFLGPATLHVLQRKKI